MLLKHRLKKIEKRIQIEPKRTGLWIVKRICLKDKKPDPKDKARVEARIQEIKEGKIKNKDGTYYQPGDTFIIISESFIPKWDDVKRLDLSGNKDFQRSMKAYRKEKPIEARIQALKKRKQELEAKIKAKKKEGEK